MAEIHPTSIVDENITLANDVIIGPHCVLRGDITLGAGTHLIGNNYLTGKLTMGKGNLVYPFVCIGFAGQDINYSCDMHEPGIVIGDNNIFREGATVHRSTQEKPTTIGNDNMFMTTSHVAHDCQIANKTTIVTDVSLGGHVHVEDEVVVGGGTVVHQFCTLGKGSMLAMGVGTSLDILPYFMLTGNNVVASINVVGMRRSGMPREEIQRRKDIFKLFYRSGKTLEKIVEQLKQAGDEIALEYVQFIENSRRGIVKPINSKRNQRRGAIPANE